METTVFMRPFHHHDIVRLFLNLSFNIKFLIMNKKFSTLMAGLMLASAFSVNAQTEAEKYENGKYYLLGNTTYGYLSVTSDAGDDYGQLDLVQSGLHLR